MAQWRDPIVCEVVDILAAVPKNVLIMPKAAQPTRQRGVLQAVMYIDNVSIMNETHDSGIVDIGFMVGHQIFWTRTFTGGVAGWWTRNHVHWTLTSDYQAVARFRLVTEGDGNYLGDTVHMNINGYYLEEYTSP